jgi:integrase
MNAGNIDWETRRLTYRRMKTGEMCCLTIGSRLEEILTQLPSQGPLFPKTRMLEAKDRSAEFRRRCRLLKIEGVSLHSYRYAWAERACLSGVPERFAQAALGHSSRAVHHAYARRAIAVCPALEDYEKKKVPLDFRPPKRPPISAEPHTRRVPSGAS